MDVSNRCSSVTNINCLTVVVYIFTIQFIATGRFKTAKMPRLCQEVVAKKLNTMTYLKFLAEPGNNACEFMAEKLEFLGILERFILCFLKILQMNMISDENMYVQSSFLLNICQSDLKKLYFTRNCTHFYNFCSKWYSLNTIQDTSYSKF